jgi:hypothetical protein
MSTLARADAGADAGDTDSESESGFCDSVEDPCCLDDGSDFEVAELSGCHGEPYGPADVGAQAGECTFDPDNEAYFGNCSGISKCWNFTHWFEPATEAEGGECGLCLPLCTDFTECPDGDNTMYTFDFCTSSCPDGMRCWVYQYQETKRGLCMADCVTDDDCSSGDCDPLWLVCVPQWDYCPDPNDNDTDTSSYTSDDDGGFPDSGANQGVDEGGCVCSAAWNSAAGTMLDVVLGALIR